MPKHWNNHKKYCKYNDGKLTEKNNVISIDNLPNFGFLAYRLYFNDILDEKGNWKNYVLSFKNYIEENVVLFSISDIENKGYFLINYQLLISNEHFMCSWGNFKNDLLNNAEYCLKCIGLAMHQYIVDFNESKEIDVDELKFQQIHPRITNFEPELQLKEIRVNQYGKLVTCKGTVIKARHTNVVCLYLTFKCKACGGLQLVKQLDEYYTLPLRCPTKGCKAQSKFSPMFSCPYNRIIKWQMITIQELLGTEECEIARYPRTLECELTDDLVKTFIPGDDITITGIVKMKDCKSNTGKNKQNTLFDLYLEVVSIWNTKKQNDSASHGMCFNTDDYYLIRKIHSQPQLFRLLVHSLCPNIYGHEIVKAGLLLALFGGTESDSFRAESHVLVVGDPGLGKSQMLQACSNVAPRGVYVCGNTSTSSGLTITMTRESGEYVLEAGALMLADQGCCCIDEFDKMPSQHACLLEAMEQQSISIAKAGIVCNLPTRVRILAAANPAGGHYNKGKTIAENLKMSSPMLSRFDLIFILLDQPNEELDILLTNHILRLHQKGIKRKNDGQIANTSVTEETKTERESLRYRLMLNGENLNCLPHNLLRKYIAYAQQYVHPQLSEEAKDILKEFYFSLRKQFQIGDCTPVTTRQLNSLIRLSQAIAKAEMREVATKQDAIDIVEIMKFSLTDIFSDGYGFLDKTRSQNGTGTSARGQAAKLLKILQNRSDIEAKAFFSLQEIQKFAEQVGIEKAKIYNLVEGLNLQGFLLKKGGNIYQLITAT